MSYRYLVALFTRLVLVQILVRSIILYLIATLILYSNQLYLLIDIRLLTVGLLCLAFSFTTRLLVSYSRRLLQSRTLLFRKQIYIVLSKKRRSQVLSIDTVRDVRTCQLQQVRVLLRSPSRVRRNTSYPFPYQRINRVNSTI